jgi:tRNA A37 threonylcarbamoyladenosine dehydratase
LVEPWACRGEPLHCGKLESAQDRVREVNPEIEIELHQCRFSSENASQIVNRFNGLPA